MRSDCRHCQRRRERQSGFVLTTELLLLLTTLVSGAYLGLALIRSALQG